MKLAAMTATFLIAASAHAGDMGVLRNLSDNKFEPGAGLPACVAKAVETGDPATGPSVLIVKAKSNCRVPWHWHTATENVMIVSGKAKLEMRGGSSATFGPGGFAMLPAKHVHQFTCLADCTFFIASDAAFDIHYVDASGVEITLEAALMMKK